MELIFKFCIFLPIIQLIFLIMALIYQNIKLIYYLTPLLCYGRKGRGRLCGHNFIADGILREIILKGNLGFSHPQKPFPRLAGFDIIFFIPGQVKMLRKQFCIIPGLVQHRNEVCRIQDVLDLGGTE